jgi:hypothetical protein
MQRLRSLTCGAIHAVVLLAVCAACSPASDGDRLRGGTGAVERARTAPTAKAAAARNVVERHYAEHFNSGQGFSVDTLRERKGWFAPTLYSLMLADMAPTGEIGYIEFDPFTDAQDDAATYTVGVPKTANDTVLVPVELTFGSATGTGHERRRVTLAMVPAPSGWQIANIIYADHDLMTGLRGAASGSGAPHP